MGLKTIIISEIAMYFKLVAIVIMRNVNIHNFYWLQSHRNFMVVCIHVERKYQILVKVSENKDVIFLPTSNFMNSPEFHL